MHLRITDKTDKTLQFIILSVLSVPHTHTCDISEYNFMTNWLDALEEFPLKTASVTDKTDNTSLLTTDEEQSITKWLIDIIEEDDPTVRLWVLNKCKTDPKSREYYLNRAISEVI